MKFSWNRADDGVITVYRTDDNGFVSDVADFWLNTLRAPGISRRDALAMQERYAKKFCDVMNEETSFNCPIGFEGCTENCGNYGCGN